MTHPESNGIPFVWDTTSSLPAVGDAPPREARITLTRSLTHVHCPLRGVHVELILAETLALLLAALPVSTRVRARFENTPERPADATLERAWVAENAQHVRAAALWQLLGRWVTQNMSQSGADGTPAPGGGGEHGKQKKHRRLDTLLHEVRGGRWGGGGSVRAVGCGG